MVCLLIASNAIYKHPQKSARAQLVMSFEDFAEERTASFQASQNRGELLKKQKTTLQSLGLLQFCSQTLLFSTANSLVFSSLEALEERSRWKRCTPVDILRQYVTIIALFSISAIERLSVRLNQRNRLWRRNTFDLNRTVSSRDELHSIPLRSDAVLNAVDTLSRVNGVKEILYSEHIGEHALSAYLSQPEAMMSGDRASARSSSRISTKIVLVYFVCVFDCFFLISLAH